MNESGEREVREYEKRYILHKESRLMVAKNEENQKFCEHTLRTKAHTSKHTYAYISSVVNRRKFSRRRICTIGLGGEGKNNDVHSCNLLLLLYWGL